MAERSDRRSENQAPDDEQKNALELQRQHIQTMLDSNKTKRALIVDLIATKSSQIGQLQSELNELLQNQAEEDKKMEQMIQELQYTTFQLKDWERWQLSEVDVSTITEVSTAAPQSESESEKDEQDEKHFEHVKAAIEGESSDDVQPAPTPQEKTQGQPHESEQHDQPPFEAPNTTQNAVADQNAIIQPHVEATAPERNVATPPTAPINQAHQQLPMPQVAENVRREPQAPVVATPTEALRARELPPLIPLQKYPGGIEYWELDQEVWNITFRGIANPNSYGELWHTPHRPPKGFGHEWKFEHNFFGSLEHEFEAQQRNHCNKCNGRNLIQHKTTECKLWSDHQLLYTLLLGFRCWRCLTGGHHTKECKAAHRQTCSICRSTNHSQWTCRLTAIIEESTGIYTQSQAIALSQPVIMDFMLKHQ